MEGRGGRWGKEGEGRGEERGLTIRLSAHPIKQLLPKIRQPEDVVFFLGPLDWMATLQGDLETTPYKQMQHIQPVYLAAQFLGVHYLVFREVSFIRHTIPARVGTFVNVTIRKQGILQR